MLKLSETQVVNITVKRHKDEKEWIEKATKKKKRRTKSKTGLRGFSLTG